MKNNNTVKIIISILIALIVFIACYAWMEDIKTAFVVFAIVVTVVFVKYFEITGKTSRKHNAAAEAMYYKTDFATGEIIAQLKDIKETNKNDHSKDKYDALAEAMYYKTDFATGEIIANLKNIQN